MKQKLITACVLSWLFLYPLSGLFLLLMAVATDPAQEPRVESQYTVCDLLEAIARWQERQYTFGDLLDAIEWVESKGDSNAVGDGGDAVGAYQIHKIFVDDINRLTAKMGRQGGFSAPIRTYEDRWKRDESRWMVRTYLLHYSDSYAPHYTDVLPMEKYEMMARIYNGGPDGWKKESTIPYWNKVKAVMESVKWLKTQ